jgi:AcrR family transcriptional regulator
MGLDRETVVRTALSLLDEVGLDGLTVRRIAAVLDVQAPALYWHFKNKQELLDEMATTVLRDTFGGLQPPAPGEGWRDWLLAYSRRLHQMLLSHRDGAKMMSGTYLTDDTMFGVMEVALRALVDAGFTPRDAARALHTVYSYAVGFAIEEQAIYPRPGQRSEQYDPARRAARIDAARLPLAAATGDELIGSFDERYEHGLRLILAGLERSLAEGRAHAEGG